MNKPRPHDVQCEIGMTRNIIRRLAKGFIYIIILKVITSGSSIWASEYDFTGIHYLGDYHDCSSAIDDPVRLEEVFVQACEASGAHVIDKSLTMFPGGGITLVISLSESHASIHTYPEHKSCFVDLFTCGKDCDHRSFVSVLRAHLSPKKAKEAVLERGN